MLVSIEPSSPSPTHAPPGIFAHDDTLTGQVGDTWCAGE